MKAFFIFALSILTISLFSQEKYILKIPTWEEYAEQIYTQYKEVHDQKCDTTALYSYDAVFLENYALLGPHQNEDGDLIEEGEDSYQREVFSRKTYDKLIKKLNKKVIRKMDQVVSADDADPNYIPIELKITSRVEETEESYFMAFIKISDECGCAIMYQLEVLVEGEKVGTIDMLYAGVDRDFPYLSLYFEADQLKDILAQNNIY